MRCPKTINCSNAAPSPTWKETKPLDSHIRRSNAVGRLDAHEHAAFRGSPIQRVCSSGSGRVKQLVADYEARCRHGEDSEDLTSGDVRRKRDLGQVRPLKDDDFYVPSGKHVSEFKNENKVEESPANSPSEKNAIGSDNYEEDVETSWIKVKDSDLD
ncbi:hypothetical protein CPLU01_07440 [Colletotrichum plurivorum]|uniref:Uncharacterized protein n=1 Tax=Colletotrichum plurivorum TaxID=2175906 RepID=A0A8H6KFT0_9PEZI|nr:hypothetical protein CPLU01_07440 [Colletotrichum plurivorum]